MNDSELIRAVAHHESGHAVVCFMLYGEEVIKNVQAHTAEGVEGETSTYSRLPIPLVCRPPVGEPRRGNPAPVSADAIVDAHGVLTYAGMVAEDILAERLGRPRTLLVEERGREWALDSGQRQREQLDREVLAKVASIVGDSRPAEHFYQEYWNEARRLLRASWNGVEALAEILIEHGSMHGERADSILRPILLASD